MAQSGCSIVWVGEDSTRFYAQGNGETRKAYRLLEQAKLVSNPTQRREVAVRMYAYRFAETLSPELSLEQIRGHEGVRVRNTYQHMSRRYGVKWRGRRYDRNQWGTSDPVNRALSMANALLNGLCHTAIVSGGYSPGLGFIHTGKQLSFVYDVADLYKTEFSIPIAFETAALSNENIEPRVRLLCRQRFKEAKLLQRVLPDIDNLMNLSDEALSSDSPDDPDYDEDGALPGPLLDDDMLWDEDGEEGESWL